MIEYGILSLITFFPLIGAGLILFMINEDNEVGQKKAKVIAFLSSIATFVISLSLWKNFDINANGFQFEEIIPWIKGYNISYHLGIDGISLFFILLTTLLVPICILASWENIKIRVKEYMIAFLLLETLIIGVFCALDFMVFYIFFEAMLIPMFLIIGIWGGKNRVYASIKFFLYTLAGSLFLLLAIIYIYSETKTLDIPVLMQVVPKFELCIQQYLWLALLISFAVKIPMWPFHTWLPDAHVEAPTAGSVILAGILLKMGAYGFLRFSLPMLPDASIFFSPYVFIVSSITVVYASLIALMQEDMKKLIAYSSIAHMGFVTIGIFTLNVQGIEGALMQMISHGLVSAGLFLCVGVLYDRMHTREINKYGGVVKKMPRFALVFMLFTMAAIGLPGTSGFVGEVLVLVGVFSISKIYTALTATGIVLGAIYMLWLYKRVVFGSITNKQIEELNDLTMREVVIFIPLIILTIILGLYPSIVTDIFQVPVGNLITSSLMR